MLLACAGSAQATVGVAIDGATLNITGSGGNDAPRFTFYTAGAGLTRILDARGLIYTLRAP